MSGGSRPLAWLLTLAMLAGPTAVLAQTEEPEEVPPGEPALEAADDPEGVLDTEVIGESDVGEPWTALESEPPDVDEIDDSNERAEPTDADEHGGGERDVGPAAGPAARAPWPMRRPRLELATGDGSSSIRFGFVAQLQLDFTIDGLGDGPPEQDYAVFFRRLRPDIRGSLLTRDLTYRLYLNIVPGAFEMMEFWLQYAIRPEARISVGTLKEPFTRYRLNSFQDLAFVDWSNPTRWFGADRQIGLMLHNGLEGEGAFEYQVGLFTGTNWRASNSIGLSKVYGERPPNPSSLVDPPLPSGFHPEVVFHLSYNHGGIDVGHSSDFEGGPPRFALGLSGAWDFRPTATEDMTYRFAPEVLFKAHGFHGQGVFYLGGFDEVAGTRSRLPGVLGTLLQVGYFFGRRYEAALRYTLMYVLPELRADARARADGLIAEAPDLETGAALTARYANVGRLRAEHDLGLGMSFYIVGRTLVLRLDGALLVHSLLEGDRYDVRLRSMLQLAF